jgi:hypothetical protein
MSPREPSLPACGITAWERLSYGDRLQVACKAWADEGFAAPLIVYVFYVVKLVAFLGGFLIIASTAPGGGNVLEFGSWWDLPIVFARGLIWAMLWELLGLGCGSGPLTGRYAPPVTAPLYWLRRATVRMPPFRWLRGTSGTTRSTLDVVLYLAVLGALLRALFAPALGTGEVLPIIVLLVATGLRDKTIFLAARPEHYLLAITVLMFPADFWAGQKVIMAALWFWAATSKLNLHFPSVIAVMLSNDPIVRSSRMRRWLYRSYPDDLRPSRLSATIAHGATVVEYALPAILILSDGGPITWIALGGMVAFHLGILTSFPMGVPLEWNVWFIYATCVLFGAHADVRVTSIGSPWLVALLVACLVIVPIVGNRWPERVSFLPSMRYYAGNWATSTWLWRPEARARFEAGVAAPVPSSNTQLARLYDESMIGWLLARGQAFRAMHLHGRAHNGLLEAAIADLDVAPFPAGLDAFEVIDGELVAGAALGWNFGEGHLHDERLLAAAQERSNFAYGDVRCILVEAQPALVPTLRWRIVDAAAGELAAGSVRASELLLRQPWDLSPVSVVVDPRSTDGPSTGRLERA